VSVRKDILSLYSGVIFLIIKRSFSLLGSRNKVKKRGSRESYLKDE